MTTAVTPSPSEADGNATKPRHPERSEGPSYFAPGATDPPSRPEPAGAPPQISCEAATCTLRAEAVEPVLLDAQLRWAARPIVERIQPIRLARHWMAAHPEAFAQAISPALTRSHADTLVTELLPLLDAMRFLERQAHKLLSPKKLGRSGRPLWLAGVEAEVHRDPLGHVVVIGPSNFPLFLPGVHAMQALVAGNAVTWKPGNGGQQVALLVAHALREAGLPRGIFCVTDESVEAAETALQRPPDKVVFTGSRTAGQQVLRTLAETATPATMELSGSDAIIVLPSADLTLVSKAVAFGLRLNGAEVCMSPRRLIATQETLRALRPLLRAELARVPPVPLKARTAALLDLLTSGAVAQGAHLSTAINANAQMPLLVDNAQPGMAIARSDLFAPVLSLLEAPSALHLAGIVNDCPYGLTAAIFGSAPEARALGAQLRVGTVLINDLIAPTADPRVPFAGRGHSGFGATRGAEGLLEMTAPKTMLVRRKGSTRHYDPVGVKEAPLFAALIGAMHGGTLSTRFACLRKVIAQGINLRSAQKHTQGR